MNIKPLIFIAVVIVITIIPSLVQGQYYPAPQPEDPANERVLLDQLARGISGKEKINVLLRLANLNLNKPLQYKSDLKHALVFATNARDLSITYSDKKNTDRAQLLRADILSFQGDLIGAENILSTLKDTSRAELLLNLSFKYRLRDITEKADDWKKGIAMAEEARHLAFQYKLPLYDIMACIDIAMIHLDQSTGHPEQELLVVLKSYKASGYPDLHYIFIALTEYYFVKGIPDKAEFYCLEALKSVKSTRDTLISGDIYSFYALITYHRGNLQKALDLTNIAIADLKIHAGQASLSDRGMLAFPVTILRKMKRYQDAIVYARKIQTEYPAKTIESQVADIKILANIYRDMKNYKEAQRLFLKALKIDNDRQITNIALYKDIGQLYVESGQYKKAKPYLYKVYNKKDYSMPSAAMSHLNYMLFLADSATGDYLSAIKHLNYSRGQEDFELRQKMEQETKRLDVQFETKQKEERIKFLNEKAELDKRNLHQANLLKNVTVIGILLALTIAGLLYRQNRRKQKTNEVVTVKNQLLQRLVEEKEWLLKEVHHRVKNNLQIIISLLYSQAAYLQDRDIIEAIKDSQNRVQAISIIHHKLYSKSNLSTIMMSDYVSDLVRHLCDCYDCKKRKIRFNQLIGPLNFDPSQAVPMGLILNEAITNSIKYAFGEDGGEISIKAQLLEQDTIYFSIADNGQGLPDDFDYKESSSLGMEMMRALSKQIGGVFEIRNESGVLITMKFKLVNSLKTAIEGQETI